MARIVIVGGGAIGGIMAATLFKQGQEVSLVARGAQFEAIIHRGLCLETPNQANYLQIPVVDRIASVKWTKDSIVIIAVKSQHTAQLLPELSEVAPPTTPLICAQNGVNNERIALRWFSNVYGAKISCAVSHLTPGVVLAHSFPSVGIVVMGRYPRGTDDTVSAITSLLGQSSWISRSTEKIMDWKYAKLLRSVTNAVSAIFGTQARSEYIRNSARNEAELVLRAAEIEWVDDNEWNTEGARDGFVRFQSVGNVSGSGSSSWQSLMRQTGSVETDYLNGEIVFLGRLHGIPTPVNNLICQLANDMARHHKLPGTFSVSEFMDLLNENNSGTILQRNSWV